MERNECEKINDIEEKDQDLLLKLLSHYGTITIESLKRRIEFLTDNIQDYVDAEEDWNKGDFEL